MVNTHVKFPNDVRHNTYYVADGSDLRDATEEEVKKYRLAASHKRRKPESESVRGMAETTTTAMRDKKKESARSSKRDDDRGREMSTKREIGDKGGRVESCDSRKDMGEINGSHSWSETDRNESGRRSDSRTAKRDEKGGGDVGNIDEDERDRRKIEEIRQRMENRKASKVTEIECPDVQGKSTPASGAASISAKEVQTTIDASRLEEKPTGAGKGFKKTVASRTAFSAADVTQREEAILWAASGTVSETSMEKGDGNDEMMTDTRAIVGASVVEPMVNIESADSLFVQEYVALQYPPVKEVVSSTVRLGRALVSAGYWVGRWIGGARDEDRRSQVIRNRYTTSRL